MTDASLTARPALLLAPHLEYPPHNGADIVVVEHAQALSTRLPRVDVVAAGETVTYEAGAATSRQPFGGGMRGRKAAVARTVLRRSHYLLEKFVTPSFRREVRQLLERPEYGLVWHSYLVTASVVGFPDPGRAHLVFTHNDEFEWFETLRASTTNPLGKAAASASLRWLYTYGAAHTDDFGLLHITPEDHAGWDRRVPGYRAAVVPAGVALRGAPALDVPPGAPVRFLFAGTLGVRMNLDALAHFADRYAPALRARLGSALNVAVVGSSPGDEVRALCDREGWLLRPDVSEDEMDARFRAATFSLLPFPYATGTKLKLLKSLSYGVPVLATSAVGARPDLLAPPSLVSDDPDAWADHVAALQARGIDGEDRQRLRALAASHSWGTSADLVLDAARSWRSA